MKVGVIDYGVGNLGSVLRALETLRVTPLLIERARDAHCADALILPGVGGFSECKKILDQGGWTDVIREEALIYEKPLLGICLGMQLLADFGYEGADCASPSRGLGLISGEVVSLKSVGCPNRVPHVGWNSVRVNIESSLFNTIPDGGDFYFVHSYAFLPKDSGVVIATVDYGVKVTAAIAYKNIMGTQFHPEKSSRLGVRLLNNFVRSVNAES